MLTVNVNKMSPTLELARISNHALKQPNEINHVV